ncbi:MAG: hypothetical protein K0S56_571 [Microvirga sp.]|jgi:hypothetical protein|nr:hypothetical protein [Microvirga sp.]
MAEIAGALVAIAVLLGIAVLWTLATTRRAHDPHAEPYGDIPQVRR